MNTPETIMNMYKEIHELEQEAIRVNLDPSYIYMWKRSAIIQVRSCKKNIRNKEEFYYELANFNICMSVMARNLIIM
jgi:hypothetical protein